MSENKASVLNLGRNHLETVLLLSIPSIMEQMVFSIFNICDTAQVGALGAEASAAVGILSPVFWVLNGTMTAVSTGFSVMTAHSVGEDDLEKASRSANKSIFTGLFLGTVISLLFFILSPVIPRLLGADESIAKMSAVYMAIYSFSFLVNLTGTACSSTLRCIGLTKLPLMLNSIAVTTNVILNFLFIYPTKTYNILGFSITIWGAGKGVAGAAFATLLSISLSTVLLFTGVLHNNRGINISLRAIFKREAENRDIYQKARSIGLPIFFERLTINVGQIFYMRCISSMGTAAVAAHHLALQAETFAYLPNNGIQAAVQTLISQSMGAKRLDDGEKFADYSASLGALYGAFAGVMFFFFGKPIMSIFISDPEIINVGASLLKIVAFGEAFQALNIVLSGALRGIGDTRSPFFIGLTGIWGIRILFSYTLAFVFGLGIKSAWSAMLLDLIVRGTITTAVFKRKFKKIKEQSN